MNTPGRGGDAEALAGSSSRSRTVSIPDISPRKPREKLGVSRR